MAMFTKDLNCWGTGKKDLLSSRRVAFSHTGTALRNKTIASTSVVIV